MIIHIDTIKDLLSGQTDVLRDTYKVKNLGVFGSVARTQNIETSDIDMLVEFLEPIGFFRFIELENFLSHVLGKKVDLVTRKALKPIIKDEILQEVVYV